MTEIMARDRAAGGGHPHAQEAGAGMPPGRQSLPQDAGPEPGARRAPGEMGTGENYSAPSRQQSERFPANRPHGGRPVDGRVAPQPTGSHPADHSPAG